MKIRTDFVTNSSSSSFVACGIKSPEIVKLLLEVLEGEKGTIDVEHTKWGDDVVFQRDDILGYMEFYRGIISIVAQMGDVFPAYEKFYINNCGEGEDRTEKQKQHDDKKAVDLIYDILLSFLPNISYSERTELKKYVEVAQNNGCVIGKTYDDDTDGFDEPRFVESDFPKVVVSNNNNSTSSGNTNTSSNTLNTKQLSNSEIKKLYKYEKSGDGVCILEYKGKETEVVIPEKIGKNYVTHIKSNAFLRCSSVLKITIPSSVVQIDTDGAISPCIESLVVEKGNKVYHSDGNCIINTKTKELVIGCKKSIIPNDGSVISIGRNAFLVCTGLKNIIIPNCITKIGACAFKKTGLKRIDIPDSVSEIGEEAFKDCPNTLYTIKDDIKYIGNWIIEPTNNYIEELIISADAKNVVKNAFYWVKNLKKIYVKDGNKSFIADGNCLIDIRNKTLIKGCSNSVIPTNGCVEIIDDYAFYYCKGISKIVIPDGTTTIRKSVFQNSSITEIDIPKTTNYIGKDALLCTNLEKIFVDEKNASYNSSSNCLIETESKELIKACNNSFIPNDGSVTTIKEYAFSGCELTSVEIPNSITKIEKCAFSGCELTSVEIPNSITKIEEYTFSSCKSLESIELPNSLTSIGDNAFECCYSLTNVEIPDSVTSIGLATFFGCSTITSIKIPNSVTQIGKDAFAMCNRLTSIVIPNSITRIGDGTFSGCSSLISIVIPNSITCIGDSTFSGCSSLTSVELPKSLTRIGKYAFYKTGLKTITIPSSVLKIGNDAFSTCDYLRHIYCESFMSSGEWDILWKHNCNAQIHWECSK